MIFTALRKRGSFVVEERYIVVSNEGLARIRFADSRMSLCQEKLLPRKFAHKMNIVTQGRMNIINSFIPEKRALYLSNRHDCLANNNRDKITIELEEK